VKHRVGLAWAGEWAGGKILQPMIGKLEARMLAGDQQPGRLAGGGKGMDDWAEFDGFWTRADNKRDT
jgi:hypothetical protein